MHLHVNINIDTFMYKILGIAKNHTKILIKIILIIEW